MVNIRHILCPTDFSEASRRAFDYAVAVARWYDARLTLFHVSPVQPIIAVGATAAVLPPVYLTADQRQQLLISMQRDAHAEVGPRVPFETDIAEGDIVSEILEKAATHPTDLVVLGTHGLSGFDRLVMGSVTEKVLRKATCPVLTVPPLAPDAVPVPPALFKRILCAVDFSPCSLHALSYALSIAQTADARLTVLNVLEHLFSDEPRPPLSPALRQYAASIEGDRRMRLAEAVPDTARTFCTIETLFSEGRPYREILRIAQEQKSDLIVMGVRGRGAVDRVVFGSTTQHVVRHATCPVLTIRKD
jgi:nucleotide-binding universal stress UspA family protein